MKFYAPTLLFETYISKKIPRIFTAWGAICFDSKKRESSSGQPSEFMEPCRVDVMYLISTSLHPCVTRNQKDRISKNNRLIFFGSFGAPAKAVEGKKPERFVCTLLELSISLLFSLKKVA